jgi:hypothetical protein
MIGRLTSPFSGGAPDLRRRVADAEASGTVGRVHFIHLADRCMRLLGGAITEAFPWLSNQTS